MRGRIIVAATTAAVIAAGGGVAYAQAQGSSGSYRTATVTVGDVDKILALAGTIAASSRQDLSFGIGGTVSKVAVEAGDTVTSGDVLAKLDDTGLDTAVTKARANLAKAKAQLESDQNSQSSTVAKSVNSGQGSSAPSTPSTSSPSAISPQLMAALAALKTQQSAVTAAQSEATAAITAAKAALSAQSDACSADESAADTGADASEAAAGLPDECAAALATVQGAQDEVSDKQDTLQAALEILSQTLAGAIQELGTASPGATTGGSDDAGQGSSADAPSGASSGGGAASAAMLAQDQASIDTAEAALTEAERNRDAASLTAPFDGTILSVAPAKGDTVAAEDVVIVIVGDGDTTATTTVTTEQVGDVKVGQTASVTPAGATKAVPATVTSIGLLPDSSSDTAAYPVTLLLSGSVAAPEGSTASIALITGTIKGALTVPSSAVSTTGRTTVTLMTDGKKVLTPVTVGVVGSTRTSITQGVTKGQEVVIADLSAELPSGDGSSTRIPGSGGFGGGAPPSGLRQLRTGG